jgi:CRISPR-associated protein Csm1
MGGQINNLPVDEKTGEILQNAIRYASGGKGTIEQPSPISALPIEAVDLSKPLLSIFPELFLHPESRTSDDDKKKQDFYISPKISLNDELSYPQKLPAELGQLKIELEKEILNLQSDFEADAKAFGLIGSDLNQVSADKLLLMLEKYGATLPSKFDYISLFDLFRITSAFADCIEKAEEQPRFLLVCADLSGIQDFVYGISSSGALKSLRARSFFLEFVMEHVLTVLIESVGVSRANLIYSGGGNFFLLLPNSQSAKKEIDKIRKAVNRYFYEHFEGRIYLALGFVEFDEEALIFKEHPDKFAIFWQEGFDLLEKLKQQKFNDLIDSELFKAVDPINPFADVPDSPLKDNPPSNDNECQICHREDMPKEETKRGLYRDDVQMIVCSNCYHLYHLGDDLTDFRYVFRFSNQSKVKERGVIKLPKGDGSYYFYQLSNQDRVQEPYLPEGCDRVWGKNSLEIVPNQNRAYYSGLSVPVSLLLTSDVVVKAGDLKANFGCPDGKLYEKAYEIEKDNYHELTRKRDEEKINPPASTTVSMSGLAATARGIKRIAALRMDIDNLGLLFSEGLHDERRSLAHLATLSRKLTYFFKHDVEHICNGRKNDGTLIEPVTDISQRLARKASKRMVTMIYAGGDDLFLVGAWSDVPEVAVDIRNHFKKLTCESDTCSHKRFLSISAGITVHGPKFPLYRMAKASEIAQKIAKQIEPISCEQYNCLQKYDECYLYQEQNNECKRKDSIALFVTDWLKQEVKRIDDERRKGATRFERDSNLEPINFALSFDDFNKRVVEIVRQFLKMCGIKNADAFEPKFPHSFIKRLHLVTETWRSQGLLYIPSLKYSLARTANAIKSADKNSFTTLSSFLSQNMIDSEVMRTFHQPLMWIGWLTRLLGED